MDIITKLNSMKKPELLILARQVNKEIKIKDVHKLKKKDLVTELLLRQEIVKEIMKGNIKVQPKGKRTKKKKTDEENNKILKEISILNKEAIKAKKQGEKAKILNQISKLQSKLSF
tara:strand:+ start:122 stop:469 length:348 start_codon:yes stop_codon:yes gene_type:complete